MQIHDCYLIEVIATEPAFQSEFGCLGNFEGRMLRNFRAAVEDWEEVCSALGAWEARFLNVDNAGAAKDLHKRWVNELLSWGEMVRKATGDPNFPDLALAERVRRRLRHLDDKMALWHRDMTEAEEERILNAAFA